MCSLLLTSEFYLPVLHIYCGHWDIKVGIVFHFLFILFVFNSDFLCYLTTVVLSPCAAALLYMHCVCVLCVHKCKKLLRQNHKTNTLIPQFAL